MLDTPTRHTPIDPAAARMYRRALAGWAVDSLRLRRSGLDRPTSRAVGAWGGVGVGARRAGGRARHRLAG